MAYESVPLEGFAAAFGTETEISSVALGGKIIAVSDEFFAKAANLLKVEPAPSLKGQFGPNGALYSGWETRRHNPAFDWCIIKFGAAGLVSGFDIDTSHFNGNEAPEASVQALLNVSNAEPSADDPRWTEILPKVSLGPNLRHLFKIHRTSEAYNYVKLNMYPDGGIARFRVYGIIQAVFTEDFDESIDLAHVFSGGRAVFVSDQHFGVGSNLLLPGRGKDMGDGWETKRSRIKDHKDWVIIQLGAPGILEKAEIDTAHFKGNFPESCELHALNSKDIIPNVDESAWTRILQRTKLKADVQHYFDLENVQNQIYSHVRVTIYPDGGIKRVRIFGMRVVEDKTAVEDHHTVLPSEGQIPNTGVLHVVPLSAEAFAPFGHVVQAFSSADAAPKGTKVTSANQGSALKFHKLAPIVSSYPPALPGSPSATAGLSVYRCSPLDFDFRRDHTEEGPGWEVRLLERHPHTNQAFIPMGIGSGESLKDGNALQNHGRAYLVVVACNGEDDKPDLMTLRAFLAGAGQSVVYATGIWREPYNLFMMDFTCVETQIGDGSAADCEVVELDGSGGYPRVKIPPF
ncbi:allantoicase [Fomitiporia mediterranea MF3/22]|uniref:allantoicase n=1 Tax=Fomitiporia mediterranea (strain MF3/22) TaxID=694068 RepID=UPI0004409A71|nr:allantoicase [Fomitiporia mediterranea MF3/22]EJD02860.1 allantoicase [Fomitiporia mediterranea MF3/22]